MSLKAANVIIKGLGAPLLMHNNIGVNPTHPLAMEKKAITDKKRKKTEEDNLRILDLSWEMGLYLDGLGNPCIPSKNIKACIRDGAKAKRKGRDIVSGIDVSAVPEGPPITDVPLIYVGPKNKDALMQDPRFRNVQVGKIDRSAVIICRPQFPTWELAFTVTYDNDIIETKDLKEALDVAGKRIGLGDYRPEFGRFQVTKFEEIAAR